MIDVAECARKIGSLSENHDFAAVRNSIISLTQFIEYNCMWLTFKPDCNMTNALRGFYCFPNSFLVKLNPSDFLKLYTHAEQYFNIKFNPVPFVVNTPVNVNGNITIDSDCSAFTQNSAEITATNNFNDKIITLFSTRKIPNNV